MSYWPYWKIVVATVILTMLLFAATGLAGNNVRTWMILVLSFLLAGLLCLLKAIKRQDEQREYLKFLRESAGPKRGTDGEDWTWV